MRRGLVALLVVAGCHKASSVASSKDADALWALAPEGTKLGVVATPRALAMIEHGWQDIHAFLSKAPDLAPLGKTIDEQLQQFTGAPDLRFADFGLSTKKGGALFLISPAEVVMIVPVADRDKFLAMVHGTKGSGADTIDGAICKDVRGVYACASNEAVFEKLGKSKLRDKLDVRGDIEVVAADVPGVMLKSGVGVVQLERGAVVVRGTLAGLPADTLAKLGTPIKPVVDRDRSSGFGVINLGNLAAQLPDAPIVGGVTTTQLLHSFVGPLTMSVPAGRLAIDMRAALTDPGPVQTLLEHCTELVPGATFQDGTCHTSTPLNVDIDSWIDGKTLRLGTKNAPAGKSVPLTPFAAELADGSWSFALWGRGSVLASPVEALPPIPPAITSDPQASAMVRAMLMIDEVGIGVRADGDKVHFVAMVRTAWSNPDNIVSKLAATTVSDVFAGKGSAVTVGLPASAPLARDVEAGSLGLMLPLSVIGIMSATAVSAFTDYMQKSKKTEASLMLHHLEKNLRVYWGTYNAFPVGDVPLTPAASCCQGPHGKCAMDENTWTAGPWKELDFKMYEPYLFQYSYHSDGKTVEVDAVGDLDCDGNTITYRLELDGTSGEPQTRFEEPPPNTD